MHKRLKYDFQIYFVDNGKKEKKRKKKTVIRYNFERKLKNNNNLINSTR